MDIEINWLAVVLATVISTIIAAVWYMDSAFGIAWKKITKINTKRAEKAGYIPMLVVLVINFFTALVLAGIISIVAFFFGGSSLWLTLATGFVMWLVFSAATLLTHNMFEQKQLKLTAINSGYQLALFMCISLIIGLL